MVNSLAMERVSSSEEGEIAAPYITDAEEADDSSDLEQAATKRCCWCQRFTLLLPNTRHCKDCDEKCFRLCRRCKRPFDDPKYFTLDTARCDACHRKVIKERERRNAKKIAQGSTKDAKGPSNSRKRLNKAGENKRQPNGESDIPTKKMTKEATSSIVDIRKYLAAIESSLNDEGSCDGDNPAAAESRSRSADKKIVWFGLPLIRLDIVDSQEGKRLHNLQK